MHVVSAQPRFSWMWGAHFYAFFPPPVLYVATLVVAVSILALERRQALVTALTRRASEALMARNLTIVALLSVVAGTAIFWVFRICHTYLGDGNVIVTEIDRRKLDLLPREPLTSLIQYVVYGITKPWFDAPGRNPQDIARDAVAVGSVVAGAGFLAALWLLADELVRLQRPEPGKNRHFLAALTWMCLAGQGYIQLFFGYVENYSFYAVGLVVHLALCIRCLRGACGLLLPALALYLCVALHLSSAVLAVPFLAVVVAALAAPDRRRSAIRDLGVMAVLAVVVSVVLTRHGANPISTLRDMVHTAFGERRNQGYMFSARHYRDFLNEQILIGPLGMFLFIAALVTRARGRTTGRGATMFFLLAGGAFAVACWAVGDSNLGYARDWDLLSHSGVVFTVSGLGLFFLRPAKPSTLTACLLIVCLVSIYHTVPWVATNASESRSLARLETLPLGYGRTEVLVAGWYEHRGDVAQARIWLVRSIAAYPGNPNSHFKLGMIELNEHRYDRALASFENAVGYRPDKLSYRVLAVRASFLAGQPGRAVPHLQAMVQADPGNLSVVLHLGEALHRSGRPADARSVFAEVRALCMDMLAREPSNALVLSTYGWALFRLGEVEESLHVLTRAVSVDSQQQDAHCYLGSVLRSLGRDREARAHFVRCRDLGGELSILIPDREAIIASLNSP